MQVEQLVKQLEAINPNKGTLSSPLINARWKLLYTTSASILGTSKPPFLRPQGPIYQTIGVLQLVQVHTEWRQSLHESTQSFNFSELVPVACRCCESEGKE